MTEFIFLSADHGIFFKTEEKLTMVYYSNNINYEEPNEDTESIKKNLKKQATNKRKHIRITSNVPMESVKARKA